MCILQGLLPGLRKQLRLPRLEYVSVQNQGDWMIEVPADRRDIPSVSMLTLLLSFGSQLDTLMQGDSPLQVIAGQPDLSCRSLWLALLDMGPRAASSLLLVDSSSPVWRMQPGL